MFGCPECLCSCQATFTVYILAHTELSASHSALTGLIWNIKKDDQCIINPVAASRVLLRKWETNKTPNLRWKWLWTSSYEVEFHRLTLKEEVGFLEIYKKNETLMQHLVSFVLLSIFFIGLFHLFAWYNQTLQQLKINKMCGSWTSYFFLFSFN